MLGLRKREGSEFNRRQTLQSLQRHAVDRSQRLLLLRMLQCWLCGGRCGQISSLTGYDGLTLRVSRCCVRGRYYGVSEICGMVAAQAADLGWRSNANT